MPHVLKLTLNADEIVARLLSIGEGRGVCILDSCGVGSLGSHLLIAGIDPVRSTQYFNDDPGKVLRLIDASLNGDDGVIFTLSYDLGPKLLGLSPKGRSQGQFDEPDIFLTQFSSLIFHDYATGQSWISGDPKSSEAIAKELESQPAVIPNLHIPVTLFTSNFTKAEYYEAIEKVREFIRNGDTYQTNLTQQVTGDLGNTAPDIIFQRLRSSHPASFSAYLQRPTSVVISASPERFFKIDDVRQTITTSPIKGTRSRGKTPAEDLRLIEELLESPKDRAENLMIVDLLRNDLGRVCQYGSVRVEHLCTVESHPTFHNLVSTVTGQLRPSVLPSDILKALFPCGSITGAPKISTMAIISQLEGRPRGLSMGAIGCYTPGGFGVPGSFEMSVAIRTVVITNGAATFNVGGGIVIDSHPEQEYQETLTKAAALLHALNGRLEAGGGSTEPKIISGV
jgi:para-aminobenzoate synthetase component I